MSHIRTLSLFYRKFLLHILGCIFLTTLLTWQLQEAFPVIEVFFQSRQTNYELIVDQKQLRTIVSIPGIELIEKEGLNIDTITKEIELQFDSAVAANIPDNIELWKISVSILNENREVFDETLTKAEIPLRRVEKERGESKKHLKFFIAIFFLWIFSFFYFKKRVSNFLFLVDKYQNSLSFFGVLYCSVVSLSFLIQYIFSFFVQVDLMTSLFVLPIIFFTLILKLKRSSWNAN